MSFNLQGQINYMLRYSRNLIIVSLKLLFFFSFQEIFKKWRKSRILSVFKKGRKGQSGDLQTNQSLTYLKKL